MVDGGHPAAAEEESDLSRRTDPQCLAPATDVGRPIEAEREALAGAQEGEHRDLQMCQCTIVDLHRVAVVSVVGEPHDLAAFGGELRQIYCSARTKHRGLE